MAGYTNIDNSQKSWSMFQQAFPKMFGGKDKVSPTNFQMFFDKVLLDILGSRTSLVVELNDIWDKYGELDNSETKTREELKVRGDKAVKERKQFDDLIKNITITIPGIVPRVHWEKHKKDNAQKRLLGWVIEKRAGLTGAISDPSNALIKTELEAVFDCLTPVYNSMSSKYVIHTDKKGESTMIKITSKTPTSAAEPDARPSPPLSLQIEKEGVQRAEKRSLADADKQEDDSGSPKKPKVNIPVGEWWGPQKSRLSCTDAFFDIVRQYRAYIANPTHQPGTVEHLQDIVKFLKNALGECNKRKDFIKLTLDKKWQLRDPSLKHPTAPTMVQPGVHERFHRLGERGNVGTNHFKKILGGGLTPYELEDKNHRAPAQGMLALSHAATIDSRVGLRGGWSAYDKFNEPGSDEWLRCHAVREAIPLTWREPSTLWEQLVEDATYPEIQIADRAKEERPLMTSPSWVGQPRPLSHFRSLMSKVIDLQEWHKIQGENSYDDAMLMCHNYLVSIQDAKQHIDNFINDSLNSDAPKLNEPGGKEKPKVRYGNLKDRDFALPISYAFRYRMHQIFRLEVMWQSYVSGFEPLHVVLEEEKGLLQSWDLHEMLYMEWDNWRWFTLSSPVAIAQLENRYSQREILRKKWADEIKAIDFTLDRLSKNPKSFERAGEEVMAQKSTAAAAAAAAGVDFPDDSGISTLLDSGVLDKGKGEVKVKLEEQDTGTDSKMEGVDDYQDPPDLDAAQKYFEKLIGIYQKELEKTIRKNQRLDHDDLGNTCKINSNNIDIMAKEQMVWALRSEIDNLQRSLDPMADENIGRGVTQKWPAPSEFMHNITPLPRKRELPLGVTSLGLGPMPGEHPAPDHPSVLLGCPPGFAEPRRADRPRQPQMMATPTPNAGVSPPKEMSPPQKVEPPVVPAPATKSRSDAVQTKDFLPLLRDDSSWSYAPLRDFLRLHNDTWRKDDMTGSALLTWDEWINQAYNVVRVATEGSRDLFMAADSPYRTDQSLRSYIEDQYLRRFKSVDKHDKMDWRQRELERRQLITSISNQVNGVYGRAGRNRDFPKLGPLPRLDSVNKLYATPSPEMTPAVQPGGKSNQADLAKLREALKARHEHEVTIRKFTRAQSKGVVLCLKDRQALATAQRDQKYVVNAYNSLRGQLVESATAQVAVIEREENALLQQEIRTAEALVDAQANKNQVTPEPSNSSASATPAKPKLPSNTAELARATQLLAEARTRLRQSRDKYNKAVDFEEAAEKKTNAAPDDRALQLYHNLAVQRTADANNEYTDSKLNMWLQTASFQQQENWHTSPLETREQLKERYDNLSRDFDEWKADIPWDEHRPDEPAYTVSHWIINVIVLMHQAYKGVSINLTPDLFQQQYDFFWTIPGKTLEQKRRIYLFSLLNRFNEKIQECGCPGGHFVTPGPKPPKAWYSPGPDRDELLYGGAWSDVKYSGASQALQAFQSSSHEATVEDVTDEGEDQAHAGIQQFALSSSRFEKPSNSPSPMRSAQQSEQRDLQDKLRGFRMATNPPTPATTPATTKSPYSSIFATNGITSRFRRKLLPQSSGNKLTSGTSSSGSGIQKSTENNTPSPSAPEPQTPKTPASPHGSRFRIDRIIKNRVVKPGERYGPGPSSVPSPAPSFMSIGETPVPSPAPATPQAAVDDDSDAIMEYNDTPEPSPSPLPVRRTIARIMKRQAPKPPKASQYTTRPLIQQANNNPPTKSTTTKGPVKPINTAPNPAVQPPIPTPFRSAGIYDTDTDKDTKKDTTAPTTVTAKGTKKGNNGMNDAWPDLKDMITGFWIAALAYETLREKHGDKTNIPRGKSHPDWPRPVRSTKDGTYYCL